MRKLRTVLSYIKAEDIPPHWGLAPVSEVVLSAQYGMNVPSVGDGDIQIVGMKDIQDGRVRFDNLARTKVSPQELQSYRLNKGDLLINRTNSLDQVGKVGIVDADREIVFASYLVRLIADKSKIEPEYLNLWLNSSSAQKTIKRIATPAIGQANVNPTEFQKYCLVPLPTKVEQLRIVELLRTWDNGIEKMKRVRALIQQRNRGIQQKLFGAEIVRALGWRVAPLGEITSRVRRKNDGAEHPVMTISGKSGFLRQDEKFSRFMAGESLENYTLLLEGEFSYNKGNSYTYPQGCIYRLEQPTALVPNVYVSFRLHDGLNPDFYAGLFRAGFLNRQLARLINSGVRNNGLLNLSPRDFFTCEVPVPPDDEQARIAKINRTSVEEMLAIEERIELLHQQKNGLMQKLLTGQWRVPTAEVSCVSEEAAE